MSELIAIMPGFLVCIFVCISKIIEISLNSLKTVMMVKGERLKAACLGFVECVIWGLVVSSVISTLGDNLFLLFFYCFGYAVGLFVGSTLESKIALGTSKVELVANENDTKKITKYLKDNNRGFTVFKGQGSKDVVNMILIIMPRKDVKSILSDIRNICDNQAFETTSEVSKFTGGYGTKNK